MKLLMLSAYLPHPSWGAGARSYYLLQALARQHTVSLLALVDRLDKEELERVAQLEQFVHEVHTVLHPAQQPKRWRQVIQLLRRKSYLLHLFLWPRMQDTLNDILKQEQYDAVLFDSVLMAGYRLPSHIKSIINQHNIEYELLKRTYEHEKAAIRKWYNFQEYTLLKQGEVERCHNADLLLVTSEREEQILKNVLPDTSIAVVPNGVDTKFFQNTMLKNEEAHQIVFTGTMDYYPNVTAVLFFAQHCWATIRAEIPDATWLIVGRNPPPEVQDLAALPGVTVTGSVTDVRSYISSSAVAIVPVQVGSGTRLKILEALAMQKAVVSTSIGYEGLPVIAGKHLQTADDAEAFVKAVIIFLQDPDMRATFGHAGRLLVETECSWEQCGTRLLQALNKLDDIRSKTCYATN